MICGSRGRLSYGEGDEGRWWWRFVMSWWELGGCRERVSWILEGGDWTSVKSTRRSIMLVGSWVRFEL